LEKKLEVKSPPKSIRLTVHLEETTEDFFPYVDYRKLLGKQLVCTFPKKSIYLTNS
jgi:hypothetical protein